MLHAKTHTHIKHKKLKHCKAKGAGAQLSYRDQSTWPQYHDQTYAQTQFYTQHIYSNSE
jgi:hypothetical protein